MMTTTSTFRRSSSSTPLLTLRCSTRTEGDFHRERVPMAELDARRRRFVDLPWTQLDEHHGVDVVVVDTPGAADGERGDVAITSAVGAVLGCWVGDCAPVVLIGGQRQFAVVHAGWRGLAAGIVDVAIDAFDEPVERAILGPAIGACCYEFHAADAALVAAGVHASVDDVMASTTWGTPSLDVAAAVAAACAGWGLAVDVIGGCTGCAYHGFSHRMRGDAQRHVVAVWQTDPLAGG